MSDINEHLTGVKSKEKREQRTSDLISLFLILVVIISPSSILDFIPGLWLGPKSECLGALESHSHACALRTTFPLWAGV